MSRSIRINGEPAEPAEADVVEVEPGVYSAMAGGASFEARVSGDEISIAGHIFRFEIEDPRQWKRSGHSAGGHGSVAIAAAMPGRVIRILATAGDEVVEGQGIIVVEAMKMQNELRAPRAGRITRIDVKEMDSVKAGAVLATIE